jgi:prepilin-type N-terminal cleavage/methylation domain-containing protein
MGSSKWPDGFTLVEIIVALAIFGVVSGASFQQFVRVSRAYRQQVERLEINSDLRVGVSIIRGELLNLDARDSVGSDILAMGPSDISYNSMRVLMFLCQPVAQGARELIIWRTPVHGYRALDTETDSLMVHEGGGRWTRVDLEAVSGGTLCPGGSPSFTLTVQGVVSALESGGPVRAFEGSRLHLYRSSGYWLGSSRRRKNGSWTRTQPIIGPLTSGGFRLEYFAREFATSDPRSVTSVGVFLAAFGQKTGVSDSIVTRVALRNN